MRSVIAVTLALLSAGCNKDQAYYPAEQPLSYSLTMTTPHGTEEYDVSSVAYPDGHVDWAVGARVSSPLTGSSCAPSTNFDGFYFFHGMAFDALGEVDSGDFYLKLDEVNHHITGGERRLVAAGPTAWSFEVVGGELCNRETLECEPNTGFLASVELDFDLGDGAPPGVASLMQFDTTTGEPLCVTNWPS